MADLPAPEISPEVTAALASVIDPELHRPITELGMVRSLNVTDQGKATVGVALTVATCPLSDTIVEDVTKALQRVSTISEVTVVLDVMTPAERKKLIAMVRPHGRTNPFREETSLTKIYAIVSGKGGVGKSNITANLAISLARRNLSVGVIDADIHGFSLPHLLQISRNPTKIDNMIVPPENYGVKVMSIGMFLPGNQAIAWRGPMLHRAVEQFVTDVYFGDLDILLLDLPPGTGDIAISVAQLLPKSELVIVTTPQEAAVQVAERSGLLAAQTGQRVAGVVENMSWFDAPDGQRLPLFGSGGGTKLADSLSDKLEYSVPLLGQIPFDTALREGADHGVPVAYSTPTNPAAQALEAISQRLATVPRKLEGKPLPFTPK